MNFQFKSLTLKDCFYALLALGIFFIIVFSPKVTPHAWAGENTSPAYVCLETNSTAVREEIVEIIQDSNAHLVSCDHSYDFRIVTNKSEMRHGTFVTEVRISFDVYDVHGSNVTWEPTLTSGPYYRDEDEARRIHNVSLQIQRLIRQNRQTYLSSVNGL